MDGTLTGGSDDDRRRILEQHHAYLVANATYDWQALEGIFSAAPDAVFFNLNGHTYHGREHWTRLWQYYADRVSNSVWQPIDLGGVVSGDLAVVWCERQTDYKWTGAGAMDVGRKPERSFVSRSTVVFRKEAGDWRIVHVHFSEQTGNPRPGGV